MLVCVHVNKISIPAITPDHALCFVVAKPDKKIVPKLNKSALNT